MFLNWTGRRRDVLVLAHELGHVKNRDILTCSVAATIASAITMLAQTALFFGGRASDDEDRSPLTAPLMLLPAPAAPGLIPMATFRPPD